MANDVAAGFPQVDLQPLSVLTVTLSDPGAKITALNVHGFQDAAPEPAAVDREPVMFLPG